MADSGEQYFLMKNLKQFLVYNAELIIEVTENVESLYKELRPLKTFLVKKLEYEMVREFVRKTRNVAEAAEDVIDAFVIQPAVQKPREGEGALFNHNLDQGEREMADSVSGDQREQFFMQNIVYNAELIIKVKENVESLYKELRTLKAILMEDDSEMVKEFVKRIRGVAYAAEDVIDTSIIQLPPFQKPLRQGLFNNPILPIHKASKQIEELRVKVKEIYDNKTTFDFEAIQVGVCCSSNGCVPPVISDPEVNKIYDNKMFSFEALQIKEYYSSNRSTPVEEDNVVVGFDEEIRILVDRLTVEQEKLEIISVIGKGGLGKTTLARKVYTDPKIENEFYNRAWVYVSQEYNQRDVFLRILGSITQITEEMFRMNDERLAEELRKKLQDGKYLIVLDDVWTIKVWDQLKLAFPNNNNKSRVMLTSRNKDVAVHANPDFVHHLCCLTDEESWELLRKKVFRKQSCPLELVDLGKEIAKECEGLPLAIVVIAGLLIHKRESDWWKTVAQTVKRYVVSDPEQCREVLALSYKYLPHHLTPCFLYFGIFPEDFEIPVWKLIRLWVAEGFIQQELVVNLEDIAEDYLEDLVDRHLVLVEKRRSNGRIKTCRVHDILRELCLVKAHEVNFFKEIKVGFKSNSSLSSNPTKNNQRRICIHSNVLEYISSKPYAPHACSLLCFSLEETELPLAHISFIPRAFKLIRVLDINHIYFPRFPKEIIQLIHLRYIALSGDFNILPASFSNLCNTQTLIVDTSSRTLDIKADIWKMLHLRHLYTSASSQLQGPAKGRKAEDSGIRSNIQTMSTISPESCTEYVLGRTPNLKKLGIRGKLFTLVEVRGGSSLFDNLAKLDGVETMKLLNDTFPLPPLNCKLPGLPQGYKFPPNLKKLTLSDTFIDWAHMVTLGTLQNLEVLKLKDNAFKGWQWEPIDGGFRLLKFLHIGRTDLEQWRASAHHFPRLQRLVIRHCEKLEEIPSSLGNISSLQTIELYWPTRYTADSARKIKEQRQQMQQEHSSINSGFKLTVYPPEQ